MTESLVASLLRSLCAEREILLHYTLGEWMIRDPVDGRILAQDRSIFSAIERALQRVST